MGTMIEWDKSTEGGGERQREVTLKADQKKRRCSREI